MSKLVPVKAHLSKTKKGKVFIVPRHTRNVVAATPIGNSVAVLREKHKAEQQDVEVANTFLYHGSEFENLKKLLRIPPAWTEIKINSNQDATLLATGKDKVGKTQYVYNPKFTERNAEIKFERNNQLLSRASFIVRKNLANTKSKDSKISDAASIIEVMQATGLRQGSLKDTHAKKKAYGASTLLGQHVLVKDGVVTLKFDGKKGVPQQHVVTDKTAATILAERKKKAGNNGRLFTSTDADLRKYVKTLDKISFKPKDFRTLKGTDVAIKEVKKYPRAKTMNEYKKTVTAIAKTVAGVLGNRPQEALRSYINPFVFTALKPI